MQSQPNSPEELISTPLSSAETSTISELFDSDPTDWTDSDIDRMIEHLRSERVRWMAAPKEKKPAKAPPPNLKGLSGGDLLAALGLDKK